MPRYGLFDSASTSVLRYFKALALPRGMHENSDGGDQPLCIRALMQHGRGGVPACVLAFAVTRGDWVSNYFPWARSPSPGLSLFVLMGSGTGI